MEKGVYFPKKMGADKGMILNLLNTDKLGSFIRSDIRYSDSLRVYA